MKNKLVLILLFVLPIATYLIFSSATHNSLFLPTLSKNNAEIPENWTSLDTSKIALKGKITILGFVGNNVIENRGNFFNLNQKIYNKFKGFTDFQMVMVTPKGNEAKAEQILSELEPITENMSGWKFVFAEPEAIQAYYDSYKLAGSLDENLGTPSVIIVDKELNHRGRKGKDRKGDEEYKERIQDLDNKSQEAALNDSTAINKYKEWEANIQKQQKINEEKSKAITIEKNTKRAKTLEKEFNSLRNIPSQMSPNDTIQAINKNTI